MHEKFLGWSIAALEASFHLVDLRARKQAGLVSQLAKVVKVVKTGTLTKKVTLKGIGATAGAKAAIEAAGGSLA